VARGLKPPDENKEISFAALEALRHPKNCHPKAKSPKGCGASLRGRAEGGRPHIKPVPTLAVPALKIRPDNHCSQVKNCKTCRSTIDLRRSTVDAGFGQFFYYTYISTSGTFLTIQSEAFCARKIALAWGGLP
jgi:hypothetical protein